MHPFFAHDHAVSKYLTLLFDPIIYSHITFHECLFSLFYNFLFPDCAHTSWQIHLNCSYFKKNIHATPALNSINWRRDYCSLVYSFSSVSAQPFCFNQIYRFSNFSSLGYLHIHFLTTISFLIQYYSQVLTLQPPLDSHRPLACHTVTPLPFPQPSLCLSQHFPLNVFSKPLKHTTSFCNSSSLSVNNIITCALKRLEINYLSSPKLTFTSRSNIFALASLLISLLR